MGLTIRFWRPDLNGQPQKIQYPLDPNPMFWPPIDDAVIELRGEVSNLEALIAAAQEFGWEFNPFTRCFYRP